MTAAAASRALPSGGVRAFVALLELEQQALLAGDAAAVESFAREKATALERLAAAGTPGAADRPLIARMRRLNEENGRLIAWRLARAQERFAALVAPDAGAATYDAGGRLRSAAY